MIEAFIPSSATRVVVYLHPVNVRWGVDKLRAFCRDEMRMEPNDRTCFLFVNRARDTLLPYHLGFTGEQTLIKKLEKGFVHASRSRRERSPIRNSTASGAVPNPWPQYQLSIGPRCPSLLLPRLPRRGSGAPVRSRSPHRKHSR